jgi:hypothetical protein
MQRCSHPKDTLQLTQELQCVSSFRQRLYATGPARPEWSGHRLIHIPGPLHRDFTQGFLGSGLLQLTVPFEYGVFME